MFIDASEVTIDEHAVGAVHAVVRDVRITYGTATEVVTGSIDLQVRSTRQHVVDWLSRAFGDWEIALADGGLVAARPPGRRLTGLVQPEGVDGNDAVLHVVGVRVLGRDVRLPKRFVRRVVQPLPPLPQDLELGLTQIGDPDIEVALGHPGLRLPVRPEHLRAAVREGVSLLRLS